MPEAAQASSMQRVRAFGSVCVASSKQTAAEIGRAKVPYCVGCCAIFLVVLLSSIVLTLLDYSPIIFLQEAEGSEGQIDLVVKSDTSSGLLLVNYTTLTDSAAASTKAEEFSYHAPRLVVPGSAFSPSDCATSAFTPASDSRPDALGWMYARPDGSACTAQVHSTPVNGGVVGTPPATSFTCFEHWCDVGAVSSISLVAIDTAREERMDLGRGWTWDGPIPQGQVLVVEDVASALGLVAGDTMYLRVVAPLTLRHGFAADPTPTSLDGGLVQDGGWSAAAFLHPDMGLPFTVAGVVPSPQGKLGNQATDVVFVEYDSFVPHAAQFLHPAVRSGTPGTPGSPRASGVSNLHWAASEVVVNLPPSDRIPAYLSPDYSVLQARLTTFASEFMYAVGFTEADSTQPLLGALAGRQFVGLYLGLLLDILLLILFLLSSILIYSLLMINVNARTFELAVRRMLGTTRSGVVGLLSLQAFAYSIPAWILGLLVAQGLAAVILAGFGTTAGIQVPLGLSGRAVGIATALALTIPLIGSIGPIRTALGTTIREALDQDRPKASAVEVNLERSADGRVSLPLVAFGVLVTVFGFCIYYLLPLALLSSNLSLFFQIFFAILVGLLLGLTLLALNTEILAERALAALFLSWWEHGAIVKLSLSNLIAHRRRNRKTTIMYALSVAFIVFVTVAANQEVQSATYAVQQAAGAPLVVDPPAPPDVVEGSLYAATMARLDAALQRLEGEGLVSAHAWQTSSWQRMAAGLGVEGPDMTNLGRVASTTVRVRGVSPGYWEATYPQYTQVGTPDPTSGLSLAEQYYTARGGQGITVSSFFSLPTIISARVGRDVNLETKGVAGVDSAEATVDEGEGEGAGAFGVAAETAGVVVRDRLRLYSTLDSSSGMQFTAYNSGARTAVVGIPTLIRLLAARGLSLDPLSLTYSRCVVMPRDEEGGTLDAVKAALVDAVGPGGWGVEDVRDAVQDLETILLVLNFFFTLLTVVALALCFFSLLASMVANIAEQKKEIGVLLAVGLRPSHMIRVYVYEAFVLVVAASIMGTFIGVIVAWTFAQQRALFTQLPVVFFFPWANLLTVILVSAIAALLSSALPAWRLTKQPITRLLRSG